MKKVVAIILISMIVLGMFAGCQTENKNNTNNNANEKNNENVNMKDSSSKESNENDVSENEESTKEDDYKEHYNYSITGHFLEQGADYENDELAQHFFEKFNISFEFIPIGWGDWNDRNRVWVSSGDMPDLVFWDFNYVDYVNYSEQGLIREIPKGYEDNYPNLASAISKTGIADYTKKKMDDKLYMIPKVVFFDMPSNPLTDHMTTYYRKDWTDELGIEIDNKMTIDDFQALLETLSENEKNGGFGLISTPDRILNTIMNVYNPKYLDFYSNGEEYVWGPSDAKTLEGLKKVKEFYDAGLIYEDFYTIKSRGDYMPKFYAQQAGVVVHTGAYGEAYKVFQEFNQANPDLSLYDSMDTFVVTDNEGKWNGPEATNYWAATLFSPELEDDKMDRILSVMDYTCEPETQNLIHLGFEGKDYKIENDEIVITRDKDDNGVVKSMSQIYPSYFYWALWAILWDNFDQTNPSYDKEVRDNVTNLYKTKEANLGELKEVDYNLLTFNGPNYNKFNLNIVDEFTALILKEGDLEENYYEWIEKNKKMVNDVLEELNQ